MKKIYSSALLLLMGVVALTSCKDDRDSNPVISQPSEFNLNAPATASGNVDLKESNSVQLTWSQPVFNNFNAPVIPTYTVQISHVGTFAKEYDDNADDNTGADFISLPETFNTCRADVSTESIDRALMKLTGWDETQIPAALALTVRVKAAVQDASFNEYMAVNSNTVLLNTIPYYIELMPADPETWWLIGADIADGTWGSDIGKCVIPMNYVKDFEYDKKNGQGEIYWIGYLGGNGFKLRGSMEDEWKTQIGQKDEGKDNFGKFVKINGGSKNITVPEAGLYKITLNTTKLAGIADEGDCTEAIKIEKYTEAAPVYASISIAGSWKSDWSDNIAFTPCSAGWENHDWYLLHEFDAGIEFKFKQADSWDYNSGGSFVVYSQGLYGFGVQSGDNLKIEEKGKYLILYNDITRFFRLIKQTAE